MRHRPLLMGMVGGGRDAFIGAVHRTAACMDSTEPGRAGGGVRFMAGCLSGTPEKALASGADMGLASDRNYPTWQAMLDAELARPRADQASDLSEARVDFVSIVTPNHVHFEVAEAFASAGFHIVCDKPLVHTSEQARTLVETVRKSGVVFAVTYNYSGYPMVRQAKDMVARGELGAIRKVIVEYNQGWLAAKLEQTGQKQAAWRTDPGRSGIGGAIGDIGSHAEQLVSKVTGLKLESVCADLTAFVPGRLLDDDANVLLRFQARNGVAARGVLIASQIEIEHENDLRFRVYGELGSLDWRQEEPNTLTFRSDGEPEQIFRRGNWYLGEAARAATRLPAGHPEAFLEAFANVYNNACAAMRAGSAGSFDYPTIVDGARGVHFIERVVESARSDRKWTDARFSI